MSSFLCRWEQALSSLLLLRGDLPTGGSQRGCTLKSRGTAVKTHRKENPNCSAALHTAAYPPASSHRCKASVTCARHPEPAVPPGMLGARWRMGSRHRAGMGSGGTLQLQPSLCAATKSSVQCKREKIPRSQVILIASVECSSTAADRGGQLTSKQLPLPFFRLACAPVSKIT